MPVIDHKNQPSISAPTTSEAAKAISTAVLDPTVSSDKLEAAVEAVLRKNQKAAFEAAQPKEPDWASLTEQEAYAADVYIPTVEHELPSYMDLKIKDPAYEVVWASKDQRRIGQLQAQGYELLRAEDLHPDFKVPLLFNSEGLYEYMDVVAFKVHKRILYGKRKKALQVSLNQLANRNRPPRVRMKDSYDLSAPYAPFPGAELYSDIS